MDIKDVIRKVRALSEHHHGRTQAEIDACMAMAANLMRRYQLDDAALNPDAVNVFVDEPLVKDHKKRTYLLEVAYACAEHCCCHMYHTPCKQVRLVGRTEDIYATKTLYEYIIDELERSNVRSCALMLFDSTSESAEFSRSFKLAFADSVCLRIARMRVQMEEVSDNNALIVLSRRKDELERFVENGYVESRTATGFRQEASDDLGYELGRRAGNEVNIQAGGRRRLTS